MTNKLSKIYVVAQDESILFTSSFYDKKTADSVCCIAQEQGHAEAKVISVYAALKMRYSL